MGAPFKQHHIAAAPAEPGLYRTVTGAEALALGLVAGCQLAGLQDVLRRLSDHAGVARCCTISSRLKEFGITTFQAEDEIAAICSAIGASYAGQLGDHLVVGPGHRAQDRGDGPGGHDRAAAGRSSTRSAAAPRPACRPRPSSPTSTRRSTAATRDSPMPVIAARSPADAFDCAIEACRIATHYMTPVMLLTDGYIANAAEPWQVPDMSGYAAVPGAVLRYAAGRRAGGRCPMRAATASRGRGSSPARRASSTASAGSRSSPAPATSIIRPPRTRR